VLVIEKGLPGCILVNKKGKRFVNEASPYTQVVLAMYANNTPDAPSAPAYMIFDADYRRKYPFGPFLQAQQQPDWMLPAAFRNDYLKKSDTIAGLAAQLGVDAAGLEEQVARFNANARAGHDSEFHRGEGGFDKYYGDDKVKPNPCLAPVATPPYYGIVAYPGEFGTKGGLKTDTRARVLREDGSVIPDSMRSATARPRSWGRRIRSGGHDRAGDDVRLHRRARCRGRCESTQKRERRASPSRPRCAPVLCDADPLGKGERPVLPARQIRQPPRSRRRATARQDVSLMVLAEGFSRLGVPVFMAT
jgi:hypothetical protein